MRRLVGFLAAALMVLGAAGSARANTIEIAFGNIGGAGVLFNGSGGFQFANATVGAGAGNSFQVTDAYIDPTLAALPGFFDPILGLGVYGNIAGQFQIGGYTNAAQTQASVSNTSGGVISFIDAANKALTANVVWSLIDNSGSGFGLNLVGTLNLSSLAYAGTDASFLQLLNSTAPAANITFQFSQASGITSIAQLLTTTRRGSSFSGSLSAGIPQPPPPVPEPASMLLLGTGLVGIAGFARRRTQARRQS